MNGTRECGKWKDISDMVVVIYIVKRSVAGGCPRRKWRRDMRRLSRWLARWSTTTTSCDWIFVTVHLPNPNNRPRSLLRHFAVQVRWWKRLDIRRSDYVPVGIASRWHHHSNNNHTWRPDINQINMGKQRVGPLIPGSHAAINMRPPTTAFHLRRHMPQAAPDLASATPLLSMHHAPRPHISSPVLRTRKRISPSGQSSLVWGSNP